jgi:hypothetical protein
MTEYNDKVLQQQEAIRASGAINMFDIQEVKQMANDMGADELVEFIESASPDEYHNMAEQSAKQLR